MPSWFTWFSHQSINWFRMQSTASFWLLKKIVTCKHYIALPFVILWILLILFFLFFALFLNKYKKEKKNNFRAKQTLSHESMSSDDENEQFYFQQKNYFQRFQQYDTVHTKSIRHALEYFLEDIKQNRQKTIEHFLNEVMIRDIFISIGKLLLSKDER